MALIGYIGASKKVIGAVLVELVLLFEANSANIILRNENSTARVNYAFKS